MAVWGRNDVGVNTGIFFVNFALWTVLAFRPTWDGLWDIPSGTPAYSEERFQKMPCKIGLKTPTQGTCRFLKQILSIHDKILFKETKMFTLAKNLEQLQINSLKLLLICLGLIYSFQSKIWICISFILAFIVKAFSSSVVIFFMLLIYRSCGLYLQSLVASTGPVVYSSSATAFCKHSVLSVPSAFESACAWNE